jgi:hypothetical protein
VVIHIQRLYLLKYVKISLLLPCVECKEVRGMQKSVQKSK